MEYKDILTKINTEISKNKRAAARAFLLSEKKTGKAAAAVWSEIISRFGSDSPIFDDLSDINPSRHKTTTKTGKARKKENKTVIKENNDYVEIYSGDVIGGGSSCSEIVNGLNMADIENKIYIAMDDFLQQINIDDMTKATQRQFSAFSMYVGRHIFKGTDTLKDKSLYDNNSAMVTTSNRYDLQKIVAVLNLYVYLCTKYNKAFTIDGAEYFCGVSDGFITCNAEKLTSLGFQPHKKAENTIAAGLLDGRINPTGSIAWLNYNAKWAQPAQVQHEKTVNIAVYPVLNAPAAARALPDNGEM